MKKGNIIELRNYQKQPDRNTDEKPEHGPVISNELETAIELLIQRLRELGPIQNIN